MQSNFLTRSRKFNPQKIFTSVLHLAASTNGDGYFCALRRTWEKFGSKSSQTPSNSSFAEYREKVSYKFFKDIVEADIAHHEASRQRYKGHFIYALDGDQLDLPASKNVLDQGYRGKKYSEVHETHYPKMYTVQVVDLLNGITKYFEHSSREGEVTLAQTIIPRLEKESITLYDRNFDTYATAIAHEKAENYFLVRVKSNNPRHQIAIQDFCKSRRRAAWIKINPPPQNRKTGVQLQVRLIKVKNKNTGGDMVFMTNLPKGLLRNKDAGALYQRRWGIESSFKDLTDTLKMCQWRSTKINGILQEIYALLWLANNVKRLCNHATVKARHLLQSQYSKTNFKNTVLVLVDHLELLINRKYRKLTSLLNYWIKRTVQNREHLSRSNPRQVRRFGKKYKNASRARLRRAARA